MESLENTNIPENDYGIRICPICGKEFAPAYVSQVTCGEECKKSRKKERSKKYSALERGRIKEKLDALVAELSEKTKHIEQLEITNIELREKINEIEKSVPDNSEIVEKINRIEILEKENENLKNEFAELHKKYEEMVKNVQEHTFDIKNFTLYECKRMNLKAMRLPCGKRSECYAPTRCKKVPKHYNGPAPQDKKVENFIKNYDL